MPKTPPATNLAVPAIILVETQLGENIGYAARAMANFGLSDLRLVNPREAWPGEKARAAASRADHIVDGARLFARTEDAIADLAVVYATTARPREVAKAVLGPREAAVRARATIAGGAGVGFLFGRECSGLTNDELSLADAIVTLPVDPAFSSLNIAQAGLVIAYECRLAGVAEGAVPELPFSGNIAPPATQAELLYLFEHLESALDNVGFFRPPEKRPHMVLALRAMLQRAQLTDQEVRTLRGVIAALERRPTRPRPSEDGNVTTERGRA
jgi:tRNA/rRNA methyltransferase